MSKPKWLLWGKYKRDFWLYSENEKAISKVIITASYGVSFYGVFVGVMVGDTKPKITLK